MAAICCDGPHTAPSAPSCGTTEQIIGPGEKATSFLRRFNAKHRTFAKTQENLREKGRFRRKYGAEIEAVIRQYINVRYKLAPALIAAGQHATRTGEPFVTRCDMVWPEYAEPPPPPPPPPTPKEDRNCSTVLESTDVKSAVRTATMPPKGTISQSECCDACVKDTTCSAYVWATDGVQESGYQCFTLQSTNGTAHRPSRVVGLVGPQTPQKPPPQPPAVAWSSSSTQHLFLNDTLVRTRQYY